MDKVSKTTYYRRLRNAKVLGIPVAELPDNRGKHGKQAKGSLHPRWNRTSIISSDGYRKVRIGISHPLADSNGYAYEHILVWVSAGNRKPSGETVVHHLNEDKLDNRIENLAEITRSFHNMLHNAEKERNEKGQFVGKKAAGRLLDGREHNDLPWRGK